MIASMPLSETLLAAKFSSRMLHPLMRSLTKPWHSTIHAIRLFAAAPGALAYLPLLDHQTSCATGQVARMMDSLLVFARPAELHSPQPDHDRAAGLLCCHSAFRLIRFDHEMASVPADATPQAAAMPKRRAICFSDFDGTVRPLPALGRDVQARKRTLS